MLLSSTVAQLQAENESLAKENEYYKDDLVPTMRAKSKEMQQKFEEYELERQALQKENASMKNFKTDSEQLIIEKQALLEARTRCDTLTAELATIQAKCEEQLCKMAQADRTIQGQQDKLKAFELKTNRLMIEQSEAVSTQNRLQGDIDDLKRSNEGFERENSSLVNERNQLSEENQGLERKLAENHKMYQELLEAKELEAVNYNNGIEKLIKFKDMVKELLQKNKAQIEELTQQKDAYVEEIEKLTQNIKKLQNQAQDAIEQKAISRFAQLSQEAARELRRLKDENQMLNTKVSALDQ